MANDKQDKLRKVEDVLVKHRRDYGDPAAEVQKIFDENVGWQDRHLKLETELARVRGLLQRQWISVEERLPGAGQMVFCFVVRRKKMNPQSWLGMGFRERHGWNIEDQGDGDPDVTHWQPLPDPPTLPQSSSLVPSGAESADIGKLDTADKNVHDEMAVCPDCHYPWDHCVCPVASAHEIILPTGISVHIADYQEYEAMREYIRQTIQDTADKSGVEMGKVNRVETGVLRKLLERGKLKAEEFIEYGGISRREALGMWAIKVGEVLEASAETGGEKAKFHGEWFCPKCKQKTVNIYLPDSYDEPDATAHFRCENCDWHGDSRPIFPRSSQNQTASSGVEGAHEGTTADKWPNASLGSMYEHPVPSEPFPSPRGSREPEKLNDGQKESSCPTCWARKRGDLYQGFNTPHPCQDMWHNEPVALAESSLSQGANEALETDTGWPDYKPVASLSSPPLKETK